MDSILSFDLSTRENFYEILGCDELSSTEQILTEYKLRALQFHPDKSDSPDAAEKFAQLQKAKEVLSDQVTRERYDKWLHSGIAIPYNEWCARQDMIHTSLHWATKAKKSPALESASAKESSRIEHHRWSSSDRTRDCTNDALWKFRNYQI